MKNLAWAIAILIIVILVLFLFVSKEKLNKNSQMQTQTPQIQKEYIQDSSKSASTLPFPLLKSEEIKGKKAKIETEKGIITFEFFEDASMASSNFIYLTNKKFYDGLTFHRREEGFVIQGGDPKGDGTGGPGYQFPDEKVARDYNRGVVAMANAGPNTNGSQFFIMLADAPTLAKQYTIFGQVIEGIDVIDKIQISDKITKVTII